MYIRETVEIVFVNMMADAGKVTVFAAPESVANIVAWYGGYFSGDDYGVTLNGKPAEIDHNGCLVNYSPNS